MEMRVLGGTGIRVSPLCLGTMMFGRIGNSDHDDCVRIIHRALDSGINFIDTADGYSRGESEGIVGKAIKSRRDSLVIATKFYAAMGDDPNMRGAARRWIVRAVDDSLRRLGTDYIDLPAASMGRRHRDRGDAVYPHRVGPPGQDPFFRMFQLPSRSYRRESLPG
jgi:aryl-alcohol dehydrogenase (NADP+)